MTHGEVFGWFQYGLLKFKCDAKKKKKLASRLWNQIQIIVLGNTFHRNYNRKKKHENRRIGDFPCGVWWVSCGDGSRFSRNSDSLKPLRSVRMCTDWAESSVTRCRKKRSNICLLDVRGHLHWWVEESASSSLQSHRGGELRHPGPPLLLLPPQTLWNTLNSIRICKFHELPLRLLIFLTWRENNPEDDVWLSAASENHFSQTDPPLSPPAKRKKRQI